MMAHGYATGVVRQVSGTYRCGCLCGDEFASKSARATRDEMNTHLSYHEACDQTIELGALHVDDVEFLRAAVGTVLERDPERAMALYSLLTLRLGQFRRRAA